MFQETVLAVKIAGILAILLTLLMTVYPIKLIVEIIKRSEINNLDITYYILSTSANMFWIVYSIKIDDYPLNVSKIVMFTVYLLLMNCFFYFKTDYETIISFTISFSGGIIIAFHFVSVNCSGLFASILEFFSILPIIVNLRIALENNIPESINIWNVVLTVYTNLVWIVYGILKKDNFITIVYVIQLVPCIFNIIVLSILEGKLKQDNVLTKLTYYFLQISKKKDEKLENQMVLIDL